MLGRTLDELPPQTRKLLNLITDWVNEQCQAQSIERKDFRFSRRQIRGLCGWSETQVRVHLQRLMDMEYLLTHRGGRGQSFEYELLYSGEGEQGEAFLLGLLDVEQLQSTAKNKVTADSSRGNKAAFAGPSRPQRGPVADPEKPPQPLNGKSYSETGSPEPKSMSLVV